MRTTKQEVIAVLAFVLLVGGCSRGDQEPPQDGGREPVAQEQEQPALVPGSRPDPVDVARFEEHVATELCATAMNRTRILPTGARVEQPLSVPLDGWVGDESTMAWPTGNPQLLFRQVDGDGAWSLALGAPHERPDVAARYETPGMLKTGFREQVDLSTLPTGTYRLFVTYERDSTQYMCDRRAVLRLP